jgi:hypothetical protein
VREREREWVSLCVRVNVVFLEPLDLKAETDLKETEKILAHLVSV